MNRLGLVRTWALFDASTVLEHCQGSADVHFLDYCFEVKTWRLGEVQVRIVLDGLCVAAALSVRVPPKNQELRVALLPPVGGRAAETHNSCYENQTTDAIGDASL